MAVAGALVLLALAACSDEIEYEQFNAEDDVLEVQVTAKEILPDASIDLHSSTGEVVLGSATVSPGGAPAGTLHSLVVEVIDAYENVVDRASVVIESDGYAERSLDLVRDSADEGIYKIELISQGEPGEERTDRFTIQLWDIVGDDDATATTTGTTDTGGGDTGDTGGSDTGGG